MMLHRILYLTIVIFLVVTSSSCANHNYGYIRTSIAVSEQFESGEVLSDHNYYYSGPDARPEAILALHKRYTLTPSLWKTVDLTSEQLLDWTQRIDRVHEMRSDYKGAEIISSNNERIGFWYGKYRDFIMEEGEDNEVTIFTPTHDTRRKRPFIMYPSNSKK